MKSTIIFFYLLIGYSISQACTIGVASGKATSDGRPLLWKTRDYELKPNVVHYTQTDTYNFISHITPAYGYNNSWYGVNEKGFAIANTFIPEISKGENGLGNGHLMNKALKSCASIKDFIELLDKTNEEGRTTRATFGVIDAKGGAAIFEVGANSYVMFDANDDAVAPGGYIIRTNFAESYGGNRGIERFERSSELISSFYKNNRLNVNSILKLQMRELNLSDQDKIFGNYSSCKGNICRYSSISSTVIEGVKDNEPAYLTTMWCMLGNPFSSIATPYWPVGTAPKVSSNANNQSLYAVSAKIRKHIFNHPKKKYANIANVNRVKPLIHSYEDAILQKGNTLLSKWRNSAEDKQEMLEAQKAFAEYAYKGLNDIYDNLEENSSQVITIENFPDRGVLDGKRKISISLPPNYSNSDEHYRVIYVFDGEKVFCKDKNITGRFSVNHYHDSLLAKGLIHPTIFVGIHNNKGLRAKNLTPTRGGNLGNMYQFINEVLKPHIDANYRTLKEPQYTGVSGNSLGGLASAWLACHYPETFGLAGIMSPSLWWDDNLLINKVKSNSFKKLNSRVWVMASDLEYPDMRENARTFAGILQQKGWVENDDLAFYQVYDAYHGPKGCNKSMYDMLLFLLRKEQPKLEKVNINPLKKAGYQAINIKALGEYACVFLEQWFTDGSRTTALYPEYKFENKKIVTLQNNVSGRLTPLKEGKTNLTMTYKGMSATKAIQSFDYKNYEKYNLTKTNNEVTIDGKTNDWEKLNYHIYKNASKTKEAFNFDVKYDKKFIYVMIQVFDEKTITNPENRRKSQDNIVVDFDARPDPQRMLGRGRNGFDPFSRLKLFPDKSGMQNLIKMGAYNKYIPENTKVACLITDYGYNMEIAFPVDFLQQKQGKNWKEFRLNICRTDVDASDFKKTSVWWQPKWSGKRNFNGSGTFKK